jgi:fructose-1,6-bisphosphatase/inositol monophosphatase family enzyme
VRTVDLDGFACLLRQVSREVILPRFEALHEVLVHAKATPEDPADIVTEVDLEVERILTAEILSRDDAALVIGEEATAAEPTLRDRLADAPRAWLVDPVDGTRNFSEGRDTFGVMVTFCAHGDAVASWIRNAIIAVGSTLARGSADVHGAALDGHGGRRDARRGAAWG